MRSQFSIGIYIYEDAEVLDFAGPFEVFSTAKRLADSDWQINLIANEKGLVEARGHFPVYSHYSINTHPKLDLLMVVGGDHIKEFQNPDTAQWLRDQDQITERTVSVCTGVFFLASAGLINGRRVTTHWEDQQELQSRFPLIDVVSDCRYVTDGKYTTSGGISAGIDMSLAIVAELFGKELAIKTAVQMEYRWEE
ncbi:DJ-1/PfpI family protein [Vibrio astriarenae]|uniref:DJ-1/PfpI family protein n=1 Tax=Vibrio astriarenae TaxID=1481923 RepID=UPI00373598B5